MSFPRNLSILVIDDSADPNKPQAKLLPHIDSYSFLGSTSSPALCRWQQAIEHHFRHASNLRPPDLVVCDVVFADDKSTPLEYFQEEYPGYRGPLLPTGLLHLLPFATMARYADTPIAIQVYTGHAKVWETELERVLNEKVEERERLNVRLNEPFPKCSAVLESREIQMRLMVGLAAHLIGELAAILGEKLVAPPEENLTRKAILENCWSWLGEDLPVSGEDASRLAVGTYRRKVIEAVKGKAHSMFILPSDYARMRQWCEEQHEKPKAIEPDFAIPLYLGDGTPHHIRLMSLYANVNEIDQSSPPSGWFASPAKDDSIEEPWGYTASAHPKIGHFIHALGSLAQPALDAVEVLEKFPLEGNAMRPSLKDTCGQYGDAELVEFFAIFFQIVHILHEVHKRRLQALEIGDERAIGRARIDVKQIKIAAECTSCETAQSVDQIRDRMNSSRHRPDLEHDVKSLAVKMCLEVLAYNGFVMEDEAGCWKRIDDWQDVSGESLYIPSHLEKEVWTGLPYKMKLQNKVLQTAFGWSGDDQWRRTFAEVGVGTADPKKGRVFWESAEQGDAPRWLQDYLRWYAREQLRWANQKSWPPLLTGRALLSDQAIAESVDPDDRKEDEK